MLAGVFAVCPEKSSHDNYLSSISRSTQNSSVVAVFNTKSKEEVAAIMVRLVGNEQGIQKGFRIVDEKDFLGTD